MSSTEEQAGAATETAEGAAELSLLDQAIGATKQTEPDRTQELLKTLTEEAMKGTVTYSKNLTVTFNKAIAAIDNQMSKQLNAVMHNEKFQKMEGTWRGLHHLVMNSETGAGLKIRCLNIKKKDLYKDLSKAVEFDQSQTFKKIYENEFGTPGGEPYGALIGDYEFSNHPEDIELLSSMSNVAAASFAPFITASDPKMFGFEDYTELSKPRDLDEDLRLHRIRQMAQLPRKRGQPLRDDDHAAGTRPSALWRGDVADRGVLVRRSAEGRCRCREEHGSP